jgi:Arc/MetJ-type ribon-helix-helix transcriptional regulator
MFVAQVTGKGGLYETPSEFVRDLIRRYMENTGDAERHAVGSLLRRSIAENNYTPLTAQDVASIRNGIS